MVRSAKLVPVTLPDFGEPKTEPLLTTETYATRHIKLLQAMKAARLDAVVIYGDREHVANISWATGYDPRFEEALYIVTPNRTPHLLLGNEGYPYAETAAGSFERVLWPHLSLMGQPRHAASTLHALLENAGLHAGMAIGLAGWKGYETEEGEVDDNWFETPHYVVEELRKFGRVINAAQMFMNPETGLRIINEVEQLARFEFASTLSSNAIRSFLNHVKPGMTEYEACSHMGTNAFPQSIHINMCSGPRAKYGLPSPSMRMIEEGDPIVVGHGLMGALNCRAGFMVRDASALPKGAKDYVDRLVAPYFSAAVAWYETVGIGVSGGDIFKAVMAHVGDPFFGISLNPGHLIHLDEWVHSPIKKGSRKTLKSGMALQCDIIPATGTDYFMSNIEDGIGIADKAMRDDFATRYPEPWARIQARRRFMQDVLGITLKDEILPFSNLAAWLPPFWMAQGLAMAMR
jgi:hypothetical protein